MNFFEKLVVDIVKSSIKVVAKKRMSEKAYKRTSMVLKFISSILTIALIGYFLFFLIAFSGYHGG